MVKHIGQYPKQFIMATKKWHKLGHGVK